MQAGDDKKLLQAASRKKKLEERHGLDKNAFGRKFKVSFSTSVPWRLAHALLNQCACDDPMARLHAWSETVLLS